jgi:hypothetical protein
MASGSPYTVSASYGGDGNFLTSSGSLSGNQVVNKSATSTALTSSLIPSLFGQSVTFTATVSATSPGSGTPTGTATFYLGTPTGTHSLLGTGTLDGSGKATYSTSALPGGADSIYATYGGDTNYNSNTSGVFTQNVNFTAACTTTANSGLTVKSGQSICVTGKVNGGLTVQSGGALYLNGATVNGGVTATGATSLRVCGSTINSGLSASDTSGFVTIGDGSDDGPPGCAANSISGGVTLTSGHGGFEVAANSISGGATFTGDTGAGPTTEDAVPEVEGNSITGGLSCATSNSPALTNGGQKNTVTGTKSGQCSGTGF